MATELYCFFSREAMFLVFCSTQKEGPHVIKEVRGLGGARASRGFGKEHEAKHMGRLSPLSQVSIIPSILYLTNLQIPGGFSRGYSFESVPLSIDPNTT